MLNYKQMVKVTNRDNGSVVYTVDDLGVRREFSAGETKSISIEELAKLSFTHGGKVLLTEYLIIEDKAVAAELLNIDLEPEYFYSEKDVKKLLTEGTLDQLLDCLDFAPDGIIDLIKNIAVEIKLNDIQKREAILKKTGFSIDNAIRINQESQIEGNEAEEEKKERRTTPPASAEKLDPSKKRVVTILNK